MTRAVAVVLVRARLLLLPPPPITLAVVIVDAPLRVRTGVPAPVLMIWLAVPLPPTASVVRVWLKLFRSSVPDVEPVPRVRAVVAGRALFTPDLTVPFWIAVAPE